MKRYDKYKDSGVEWIGKIPENWKVRRLGNLLTDYSEKNNSEFPLLSITREKGVILRDLEEDENHNFIPDDLSGYKKLYLNYFGMNKMKAWQGSYGISKYTGIVSPAYYTFKISDLLYPDFFHLAIRSKTYISFFGSASDGVRIGQWDLSKTRMKNIPFIIPSFPEQQAIASFLDDKTSKIDQTISIKEKEIELLKERRQILIQKAVTKGLDDKVKLKDSGVEWIGEVPEHWEVRRFKFLCHITTGSKNTENKIENGQYPFYVRSQIPERINSFTFDGEAILTAGDGAGVGKVFHYVNEKFDFHQRVYKFSNFRNVKGKFLFYYLKNNFYNVALNGEAKSTVDSLRLPLIQNFLVSFPKNKEQTEIISYLEKIEEKISKAISLKQQEIEKLKEYKTVLIDNVVTGKVKVS
ncbi:TPA: restriction endonuclease subunit S [Elizabethkingia anophelis]